jgi:hypothetical protein
MLYLLGKKPGEVRQLQGIARDGSVNWQFD